MWLLVLLVTILLDVIWVWSLTTLEDDDELQGTIASMAAASLVGFSTIIYVDDNWLLVPEIIGNGIGTILAFRIRRIISLMQLLKGE